MPSVFSNQIGILPSLEIVPFFEEGVQKSSNIDFLARSSYGSIARDMLTGSLDGGVLPWEIFISDVFALPGQRTQWDAPFFPHACATELVLRIPVHKILSAKGTTKKLPSRLVIGVESRNSLTKVQMLEWLRGLGKFPKPEVVFNFLPMDLMLQAMAADAIDGFIAASPWGLIAEEKISASSTAVSGRELSPNKSFLSAARVDRWLDSRPCGNSLRCSAASVGRSSSSR